MSDGWNEMTTQLAAYAVRYPLPDAPLLCLQGAALVGLLAAVLLLCRRHGWHIRQHSVLLGLLVGGTGYIIGALVASYGDPEIRPTLVIDFLYLGAYLGGFWGGVISFVLVEGARWQFGGVIHPMTAFSDGSVHLLAGWALRALIHPSAIVRLHASEVLLVWGGRVLSTLLASLMGVWAHSLLLEHMNLELLTRVVQYRILILPLSLLIIYALFLLLSNDAQIDAQQEREHETQRRDQVSGLPNRLALTEAAQSYWRGPRLRPLCLAVLELGNMREFLARHGAEAVSQLWQPHRAEQDGVLPREVLSVLWQLHPRLFQYGDFALALLLDGASLQELEHGRQMEQVRRRCEASLAEAWPDFRFEIRCAVVDLGEDAPETLPHVPRHLPYGNITIALNSLPCGVAYFNGLMRRDRRLDAYIEYQMGQWEEQQPVPLWLQPKLHLATGQVTGAEALLRLSDSEGRPVSPMRVISVLRRIGRLADFEWLTLASVVQLLQRYAAQLPGVSMAVNLSAESLRRRGFAAQVRALLSQYQIPSALLRLELVEWSELINDSKVRTNLAQLTSDGVPLSIDDFGTGYSNLLLLTRYAFSEVKIDRSLVISMADPKSRAVVEHIVELSHRCDAQVVAEGLETPELVAQIQAMGVDVGQGYVFSRALPPDDFVAYCQRRDPLPFRS